MHANSESACKQQRETSNEKRILSSIIEKVSRRTRNPQPLTKVAPEPVVKPVQPEPSWIRPTVLVLAALCLIGMFSTEVAGYDTWWHLKTGYYILNYRALAVPDPFLLNLTRCPTRQSHVSL